MEPKKLKKLTLKKEVVDRLKDNEMSRLFGGGNFCPTGNKLSEGTDLPSACACTTESGTPTCKY